MERISLEELVRMNACALVDRPEEVRLSIEERDDGTYYMLDCATWEIGKLIGKEGRLAASMRNILKSAARAMKLRNVYLEVSGGRDHEHPSI